MEFQKLIDRAIAIRKQYSEEEQNLYGSSWTSEEITLGFVGDVRDLAKLIIAENGKRNISNSKEKLAHELSDKTTLHPLLPRPPRSIYYGTMDT